MDHEDTTALLMKWKEIKADENLGKPFVYSGNSDLKSNLKAN